MSEFGVDDRARRPSDGGRDTRDFAELFSPNPVGGSEIILAAVVQGLVGVSGVGCLVAGGGSAPEVLGFTAALLLVSCVPLAYGLLRGRTRPAPRRARLVWGSLTLLALAAAVAIAWLVRLPLWVDLELTADCLVAWLLCHGLLGSASRRPDPAGERGELLRLVTARERRRFGRDLHDLLGYSLSALTLKAEVTERFLGRDEERARRELREILDISRKALEETRALAESYRMLSLADEIASVREVLSSSGMRVTVEGPATQGGRTGRPWEQGTLDHRVGTLLATVLREGVANLLRHSRAGVCRIRLQEERGRIRLVLSNDGASGARSRPRAQGSGLDSLARRVAEAGGTLSASVDGAGWFHLVAECPLPPPVLSAATRRPGRSESRPVDCARGA
ncbi:sensor histidine kinase [Streptomyces sp. NPDC003027]